MKRFQPGLNILLSLLTISVINSCYKIDWIGGKPPPLKNYQVEECISSLYTPNHPFLFVKSYSGINICPDGINASFFNVRSPDELFHYDLRIVYKGAFIYLINKSNELDTLYSVRMNSMNRPITSYGNEDLWDLQYEYKNNRLVAIKWGTCNTCYRDTLIYDNYGNILSIFNNGSGQGYTYVYDYSRKGKYQFYMDELKRLDNGFTLLCYLGLFPELNPVNIRTHVNLGSGPTGGFWSRSLFNHQFDDKGRLVKYDVAYDPSYKPEYSMTIKWRPN